MVRWSYYQSLMKYRYLQYLFVNQAFFFYDFIFVKGNPRHLTAALAHNFCFLIVAVDINGITVLSILSGKNMIFRQL